MNQSIKKRLVIGGVVTTLLTGSGVIWGQPKAFAPNKAEALAVREQARMRMLTQYSNADHLTDKQLVGLLGAVGFKGKALREAWAIAKKESHGQPLSHNGNRKTGDNSYGLFQVNMVGDLGAERRAKFGLRFDAELLNPVVNAQVAYSMSNGGKNWSAWKGVKTTVVKKWLALFPESKTKAVAKAKAKAKARAKAKAIAKAGA